VHSIPKFKEHRVEIKLSFSEPNEIMEIKPEKRRIITHKDFQIGEELGRGRESIVNKFFFFFDIYGKCKTL
jgi:hypothetical protein